MKHHEYKYVSKETMLNLKEWWQVDFDTFDLLETSATPQINDALRFLSLD